MGMWNYNVMRLSGMSRFMAKNFLGGKVFGSANWDEAQRYMEQSVAVEPERLVHHLDLARDLRGAWRQGQGARRSTSSTMRGARHGVQRPPLPGGGDGGAARRCGSGDARSSDGDERHRRQLRAPPHPLVRRRLALELVAAAPCAAARLARRRGRRAAAELVAQVVPRVAARGRSHGATRRPATRSAARVSSPVCGAVSSAAPAPSASAEREAGAEDGDLLPVGLVTAVAASSGARGAVAARGGLRRIGRAVGSGGGRGVRPSRECARLVRRRTW